MCEVQKKRETNIAIDSLLQLAAKPVVYILRQYKLKSMIALSTWCVGSLSNVAPNRYVATGGRTCAQIWVQCRGTSLQRDPNVESRKSGIQDNWKCLSSKQTKTRNRKESRMCEHQNVLMSLAVGVQWWPDGQTNYCYNDQQRLEHITEIASVRQLAKHGEKSWMLPLTWHHR